MPLTLALQGGGAHGAFTWGVLDALLAQPQLEVEGVSGSSAGAINAVLMAEGWRRNGRPGARERLDAFWGELGALTGVSPALHEVLMPVTRWSRRLMHGLSPALLNPLGLNPLAMLLERHIDFEALRHDSPFRLFIGTTRANTGKLRLFREHELTLEVLLASACLPKVHHPVVIDGEPHWDGGYSANPAVFPLFYDCQAGDVLLVLLTPIQHDETPVLPEDIDARLLDFAFSTHFMREMRNFAIARLKADTGAASGTLEHRLHSVRFHLIEPRGVDLMKRGETRMVPHAGLLAALREQGTAHAADWWTRHRDDLGLRPTLDVASTFL